MAVIKVRDIAWVRLQSPDLEAAERFLVDFGMVTSARTDAALYMRGTDPSHHIHITHLGPPAFLGVAFQAAAADDLDRLAALAEASNVEPLDEPGGGYRVRLTDPMGYQVEVVHGVAELEPLAVHRNVVNSGEEKYRRVDELTRLPRGPAQVKRIAHAVVMTPEVAPAIAWYREHLGLIPSDEVYLGDRTHVVASFNRCDRGPEPVDHHTFLCVEGPGRGLNHVSFEVRDIDDVFVGHEHLEAQGRYRHVLGVGRHTLGSQVFDYWQDPWGRIHEHFADTDMLTAAVPANWIPADAGLDSQWGPPVPLEFLRHYSP